MILHIAEIEIYAELNDEGREGNTEMKSVFSL